MSELKPCPFCGGEAIIDRDYRTCGVKVKCKTCRGSTGEFLIDKEDETIEAWNRRANDE